MFQVVSDCLHYLVVLCSQVMLNQLSQKLQDKMDTFKSIKKKIKTKVYDLLQSDTA